MSAKTLDPLPSARKFATKADLLDRKHDILKWMVALFVAQTALIVAVLAYVK